MKLIVDIPDDVYESVKSTKTIETTDYDIVSLYRATKNGTPVSTDGDLISRSALLKAVEEERQYLLARGQAGAEHILVHNCLPLIDNAPTVNTENCDGCLYCPNSESGTPMGVE